MKVAECTQVDEFLRRALAEDLGERGDVTSEAVFSEAERADARIAAKQDGILSGLTLIAPLFALLDPQIDVQLLAADGDRVTAGIRVAALSGPIRGILAGERTVLNLLQRLSGIATLTRRMADEIAGTGARLLDTRKTTPTLRALEKKAVVDGGGCNHRFGLFDMVLIKDTHVKAAGGVGAAIRRVRDSLGSSSGLRVEAEVQSVASFEEALDERPDRIMLDNMSLDDMRACVARARDNGAAVELEASGNVSLETVRGIAETGVDFISAGCLTHSAPALDIHLVIE
ncbi:MAG: carboxylating nicotinate-nucleotide diphosphorylase [Chitinivibrionales bacterium]|nr:carboxylating nicotinate-nucleotide diphosphorylase [Chitinivibrionales bacterium]